MNPPKNIFKLLSRLWSHISSRRRIQFGFILVLIVFAAFAEIISIGAIVPFLGILTAPDIVFNHPAAQPFIKVFGISRAEDLAITINFLIWLRRNISWWDASVFALGNHSVVLCYWCRS